MNKKRRSQKQPNRVSRGISGFKSSSMCVKFTFFGEVPLVKFAVQGLNITLLGSLRPVDMKNNPRQLILKYPKPEGKPRTWQHRVEVTHFRHSPALCSQTHLGTPFCVKQQQKKNSVPGDSIVLITKVNSTGIKLT